MKLNPENFWVFLGQEVRRTEMKSKGQEGRNTMCLQD